MSGIIDYAGMYPPANLSLEDAFRNYVRYRSDKDVWMLSRFVIPAKRLAELPAFDAELPFTTLGRGGRDAEDFLVNINLDIADINSFREARTNAIVDSYEAALPSSVLEDKFIANDIVTRSADALNWNGISVFFEAPFGEGWEGRAEKLLRALRKVKDKHVGFKLRTGGVTADAFPSPEQVAWAIAETREAGVPLKCTAGLHHPMRHFNESVQAKMYGFLNVFSAGILAFASGISQEQMQAILIDEDPSNFVFDDAGFVWKDLRVVTSEISNARLFATSFGSCSFDEPREDLQALGLL
ncbi:MAG: hypothetical protein H6634_03975 [Anaerolineales bacterium]|nr:hypothetical protein [Anaerolineales bacterium]MCB9110386.1 hypothetical protein [Anaerolineales bacterium]